MSPISNKLCPLNVRDDRFNLEKIYWLKVDNTLPDLHINKNCIVNVLHKMHKVGCLQSTQFSAI